MKFALTTITMSLKSMQKGHSIHTSDAMERFGNETKK